MKKTVMMFLMMIGTLTAHADDTYSYLVFETTGGTTTAVSITSNPTLTLSSDYATLTVGSQSFTVADLSKMYFSTSTTGIEQVQALVNGEVEVYALNGTSLGKYDNLQQAQRALKSGVYLFKNNNATLKMTVK